MNSPETKAVMKVKVEARKKQPAAVHLLPITLEAHHPSRLEGSSEMDMRKKLMNSLPLTLVML